MAMVINTNIGSENAVRLLDRSGRSMQTSMERLTSGLRLNHSKDDAAGMAIVTGMDSQIRGTSQAIRNANDGIGLVQTMDGAMEEVVGMLQRMRELGVQSMNGTYNSANRQQMNTEYKQLTSEIHRIGLTTAFNDTMLFDGTVTTVSLHVGWDVGSNNKIHISTTNVDTIATTVSGQSLTTATAASKAVGVIDNQLSAINTTRAKWGALQNRLDHTISNLQNVNENLMASRSRIQDADYAAESANLAKYQVLQQAGMSMLSQANKMPQNVMQLLQ